jgi:RNA polymerase sigma-B factor
MSLELFLAYQATNDIQVRNTLVKMNLNLARKVAHQAKSVCDEDYNDLVQEASIRLIKAVERFDPKRGCAFSSFAMPYLYNGILQYLRDKGNLIRLSQSMQTLETKGRQAIVELTNELGRKPSLLEISERLGCKPERYQEAVAAVRNSRQCSVIDSDTEEYLYSSNSLTAQDAPPEAKALDTAWLKPSEIKAMKGNGKKAKASRREAWGNLAFV